MKKKQTKRKKLNLEQRLLDIEKALREVAEAVKNSKEPYSELFVEKPKNVKEALHAMVEAGEAPKHIVENYQFLSQDPFTGYNFGSFHDFTEDARKLREDRKNSCPHLNEGGHSNIKWMEHSNNIVAGVCGTCFSPFDTRIAEDKLLFDNDPKAARNMGRAGAHAKYQPKPFIPEFALIPPTRWQQAWAWVNKKMGAFYVKQ